MNHMTDLCQFFDVKTCPVCAKPLTFYAQITDGPLWKAVETTSTSYYFSQFKLEDKALAKSYYFQITNLGDGFEIGFSTEAMRQQSKNWEFFLFSMCNQEAFEEDSYQSYSINPSAVCYYRSSPFLVFRQKEEGYCEWGLSDKEHTIKSGVRDEIFLFRIDQKDNGEKTYLLNIDYENKTTILRYFCATEAQKSDKDYEPSVFKMELPLLNVRPDFDLSRRDKLISRFDSWILMS